ncbi:pyridoxal phosphate-dependent aminotransferase [Legionella quateirensis]|uniref:Aminotransferase n=1 Tax=Legionella quateirensis TaxID=45072 RepID=A0A378KRG4_9GAMM|nr:pyridoxal phosphate-dependent aminotransferase [Legionella quateirensis]KTD49815.1 aspartate aminotransferase A [Legionella quateirensis]STY17173.1 kynurenine--oxoglutarate transaminase [Legionella quateirensis]
MITPYGQPGNQIEKVMLLSMWANYLDQQQINKKELSNKFIFAGIGKPTYPVNHHTVKAYKKYWDRLESLAEQWHDGTQFDNEGSAIGYGDPHGDKQAKAIMAEAMSAWYGAEILAKNVLFTVGGIGGLRIIFDVLNSFYATHTKYRVITPFPHYSAYANNPHHILHPIDVMSEAGYQLTARALEKSIQNALILAAQDGIQPRAVLICNPSNPLGTIINEEELENIAKTLRKYPELFIIFDEAYAEMNFVDIPSFLNSAPDLKNRTIILRSATKALSAAGERMAVILAFDDLIINELIRQQITSYIHSPRSAQIAYAETMINFSSADRRSMSSYYQSKVEYVMKRLKDMGAQMPCPNYKVEATFYALGDFSDLMGMEIPKEAETVLNKTGIIQTGEELVYSLLFKDLIMLAPLSYFGLAEDCGYLRITCSANTDELKEMMDRLEQRLLEARLLKNQFLVSEILFELEKSYESNVQLKEEVTNKLDHIKNIVPTCLGLKQQNHKMSNLLHHLVEHDILNERSHLIESAGYFKKVKKIAYIENNI